MKEQIKFEQTESGIVITVPTDILLWAAENHPEDPLIITDKPKFAKEVMFELEHNLGDQDSGLSGFQKLLDQAMNAVAENGSDSVEFKDVTY